LILRYRLYWGEIEGELLLQVRTGYDEEVVLGTDREAY
jgi:hypothetical protein